ncbi:DUF2231 domain-containing protein [Actinoplanes sp. CA-252034]|uniref:DUF2231 domain-containing protein n=1 Tax=Actinoplanes sp. CA-252034 TaxID=3239906 RepID=UPI003D99311A
MQSRLRIAGHGMQPMLLMFPLGLFWMAFVFDLATLLGAPTLLGTVAFWNLVAGLGGGLLATLASVADAIAATTPATARLFVSALLLDVGVLIVFAVLTLMRVRDPHRAISASLLTVEFAGLAAAAFSAWFSGRLATPGAPVADRRPVRGARQPVATIPTDLNRLLTHPTPPAPRRAPPPSGPPGAAAPPPQAQAPAPAAERRDVPQRRPRSAASPRPAQAGEHRDTPRPKPRRDAFPPTETADECGEAPGPELSAHRSPARTP